MSIAQFLLNSGHHNGGSFQWPVRSTVRHFHLFKARVASVAVNTEGIINVGQHSLWGNFIWSAIGQAILIPHHTRPGQTAAPFNISGNVHILNTSQEQFRKPTSMAVLACSSQPPSLARVWRGHTCSSLRHRILEMWFSIVLKRGIVSHPKSGFQHWDNLSNWIFFSSSLSCLLCGYTVAQFLEH